MQLVRGIKIPQPLCHQEDPCAAAHSLGHNQPNAQAIRIEVSKGEGCQYQDQ
jgi:hypothetical protein